MKTFLLLFGALLMPATACESHDCLVQCVVTRPPHAQAMATPTSKAPTTGKEAPPAPPAKPAPAPTEKNKPAKRTLPPHLFM
jgi:hypothetical protein